MKHIKTIIIILVFLLVAVILWPRRIEVPFAKTGSIVNETSFRDENNMPKFPGSYVWYCVTTNPDSDLSAETIKQMLPEISFNFDEYNYVYTEGYTLNKLWYKSYFWEGGDNLKHDGCVELSYGGNPYETTVYAIPKINIVSVKSDRIDYSFVDFVP